jgi:hypothetical protein
MTFNRRGEAVGEQISLHNEVLARLPRPYNGLNTDCTMAQTLPPDRRQVKWKLVTAWFVILG